MIDQIFDAVDRYLLVFLVAGLITTSFWVLIAEVKDDVTGVIPKLWDKLKAILRATIELLVRLIAGKRRPSKREICAYYSREIELNLQVWGEVTDSSAIDHLRECKQHTPIEYTRCGLNYQNRPKPQPLESKPKRQMHHTVCVRANGSHLWQLDGTCFNCGFNWRNDG